jgi:hypothetical protein
MVARIHWIQFALNISTNVILISTAAPKYQNFCAHIFERFISHVYYYHPVIRPSNEARIIHSSMLTCRPTLIS